MNPKLFRIRFINGDVVKIRANSGRQARILAQADQIKDGQDYTVDRCQEINENGLTRY